VGINIGQIWPVYNRVSKKERGHVADPDAIALLESDTIAMADRQGGSPIVLAEDHPFRTALVPLVDLLMTPTLAASGETIPWDKQSQTLCSLAVVP
jgi:hypothetical protein